MVDPVALPATTSYYYYYSLGLVLVGGNSTDVGSNHAAAKGGWKKIVEKRIILAVPSVVKNCRNKCKDLKKSKWIYSVGRSPSGSYLQLPTVGTRI